MDAVGIGRLLLIMIEQRRLFRVYIIYIRLRPVSAFCSGLCPYERRLLTLSGGDAGRGQAFVKGDQAVLSRPVSRVGGVRHALLPDQRLPLCPEGLAVFKAKGVLKQLVGHPEFHRPVPEAVGALYGGAVIKVHEVMPEGLEQRAQALLLHPAEKGEQLGQVVHADAASFLSLSAK